jgi:hypothetical protein
MDHQDLTGYYTYRSFLNLQESASDFNRIRFGEGELFLRVAPDGSIEGTLAFPADPLAREKAFMDVTGRVTSWSPPAVELEGVGRPETEIAAFDYKYDASLAPSFPNADGQREALVGTVLRAKPHDDAPAGFTASLIAVKRDFLRPKDIPGVALIPDAIAMFASRGHRLQHAVWHTVRAQWHNIRADASAVAEIKARGWWPERPPFRESRALDLENGAGEDFLYMHRKMILMLKDVYANAGTAPPTGWRSLPGPGVPQTVYNEVTGPDGKTFVFAPAASGFMVPPPARDDDVDRMMKSPSFLTGVMRPLSALFQSPRFLSALTLGALGNLLEFTVHGWMHVRWAHTIYDPATGDPIGRETLFDIDPKWDDPSNDDLGDFYSSHVHPTFWRLHGWVDDRINDWASVNADHVTKSTVDDVPWFAADRNLVQVESPFYWPGDSHGHDGHGADVRVLEEVIGIMRDVLAPRADAVAPTEAARAAALPARLAFRDALLGVVFPENVARAARG